MTIRSLLSETFKAIVAQLTTSSRTGNRAKPDLSFTKNFYHQAKTYGLTEKDARDVYYSGYPSKYKTKWLQDKMLKDYNGYQISISYFKDSRTGKPVISAIWKNKA